MAHQWFRLYSEFAHDPKIQVLSEAMQRRFVMLLCMQCSGALGNVSKTVTGNVTETFRDEEIACYLYINKKELEKTKQAFLARGFIDENWRVLNWEKRQFISDSSTPRVRKCRASNSNDLRQNETFQKQDKTVSVTPPDTDTDTDKEQIQKPSRKRAAEKVSPPPAEAKESPPKVAVEPSRHAQFRANIEKYYVSKNPMAVKCPWDGAEGKALSLFERASPDVTTEQFIKLLLNRSRSEVNHGDRPSLWIRDLTSYSTPIDRFKKPLGGNGNGRHGADGKNGAGSNLQPSKNEVTRRIIARWLEERNGDADSDTAESNQVLLPKPRS